MFSEDAVLCSDGFIMIKGLPQRLLVTGKVRTPTRGMFAVTGRAGPDSVTSNNGDYRPMVRYVASAWKELAKGDAA
jgi:hypothetical protein